MDKQQFMDNQQWDGMLAMVIKIVEKCKDKDEALIELYDLIKKDDNKKTTTTGPWEEEALRGLYDLVRKEPSSKNNKDNKDNKDSKDNKDK